ncbi:MBL fold metallo-hydrolase [Sulfobacillus thermosulfidooxidans]|uniref:MBL fold metallo-hydrolase n=1 Tax=Sulfobacillus thermosulfidooxidans TaxID=28034 RepID=UPI0006B47D7E|nr:MBL fold metallo-hydrolase [Sulfobacillus thermosulfidooxidans]
MGASLFWLGQSGFLVETTEPPSLRILIDPFLTPTKGAYDPRYRVADLGPIDWIFSTHEHLDHFDWDSIVQLKKSNPRLQIVAPAHLRQRILEAGFLASEHVVPALYEWVDINLALKIQAIPSVHALHVEQGYQLEEEDQFLGFIMEFGGIRVYHSGDTILSPALFETLRTSGIHVALLPINGRDFFREREDIVGNLSAWEAVELAGRIGAKVLIPMHYDAFANNLGDLGQVVHYAHQYWPELCVAVLGYGQEWPIYIPRMLAIKKQNG